MSGKNFLVSLGLAAGILVAFNLFVRHFARNSVPRKLVRQIDATQGITHLALGNSLMAAGFDPSAIRLTGNVTGQPPFRGVLKHHGWRVKDFTLAKPPEGQDEFVVAPAEVELP